MCTAFLCITLHNTQFQDAEVVDAGYPITVLEKELHGPNAAHFVRSITLACGSSLDAQLLCGEYFGDILGLYVWLVLSAAMLRMLAWAPKWKERNRSAARLCN